MRHGTIVFITPLDVPARVASRTQATIRSRAFCAGTMGTHREHEAPSERIMTVSSNEQVVLRDYPLTVWLMGLLFLFVGVAPFGWDTQLRVMMSLGGLLLIAFPSILIVTVDCTRGMLNLRYRSLIRGSAKAYPLSEVCFVNVAEDREGERMYRLELILWSGQVVPLRSFYSVGKGHFERRARRLRSALRVGGGEVVAPGSNIRITISKS